MKILKRLDNYVAERLRRLDEVVWSIILRLMQSAIKGFKGWKVGCWDGGSQGNAVLVRTGNPLKDYLIWLNYRLSIIFDQLDTEMCFDGKKFQAKVCRVRSKSEKKIANWFTDNGIAFQYEKPLFMGLKNRRTQAMCRLVLFLFGSKFAKIFTKKNGGYLFFPDFYLIDYGWYLEYFGLADSDQDYNSLSKAKMALYRRFQINVVYLYPRHLRNKNGIEQELALAINHFKLQV